MNLDILFNLFKRLLLIKLFRNIDKIYLFDKFINKF